MQLNESPLEDDSSSELLLVAMILLFVMKRCEKSSFLCYIAHAELQTCFPDISCCGRFGWCLRL